MKLEQWLWICLKADKLCSEQSYLVTTWSNDVQTNFSTILVSFFKFNELHFLFIL